MLTFKDYPMVVGNRVDCRLSEPLSPAPRVHRLAAEKRSR